MRSTALALLLAACGSDAVEPDSTGDGYVQSSNGDEEEEPVDDGVQIEGLMGTLSSGEIARVLEPRMQRFAQCFTNRYGELEIVGGEIDLAFRVSTDGSVRWVYPHASTIGDRITERCLLDVARSSRFTEPHGGEAEFRYPLAFDPPDDVRPPLNWDASRVSDQVADQSRSVRSCSSGPVSVTVYIGPGGNVMAAGASSTDPEASDALDCVAEAVRSWSMPDPGSYPAKVTFEID
jgi:hypothetical protein